MSAKCPVNVRLVGSSTWARPASITVMSIDRAQQAKWGRVGGLRTSATHDVREITAPARAAFAARFYQGIPDELPQAERDRRAAAAKAAYFAELTARSVAARRRRSQGA
jgi:hypothetical protein